MSECEGFKKLDRMCGHLQNFIQAVRMVNPSATSDEVLHCFVVQLGLQNKLPDVETQKDIATKMWPVAWKRVMEAEAKN